MQDRIILFPNVGCLRGGGPPNSRRLRVPHGCPHFRRSWTLGSFAPFPSATRAPANPAKMDSGFVRRANASLATTNCCLQTNDSSRYATSSSAWPEKPLGISFNRDVECSGSDRVAPSGLVCFRSASPSLSWRFYAAQIRFDEGGWVTSPSATRPWPASNILHGERDSCLAVLCSPCSPFQGF